MFSFNKIYTRILFLGAFLAAFSFAAHDKTERILKFESRIAIQKDSSIHVTETITVLSTGNSIRRGITREFPTRYRDKWGNKVNIGFDVESITMDGRPTLYTLDTFRNGKIIKIGNPDVFLQSGIHVFKIIYKTNRQLRLGFPRTDITCKEGQCTYDHSPDQIVDELYWNVTGNGSKYPIDEAIATVILPAKVDSAKIELDAYTGAFDEKLKNFEAHIDKNGIAYFKTTKALAPHEGLTIDITWPAGIITKPGFLTELGYFFRDNMQVFWLFFGWLCILFMYLPIYLRARRTKQPGTIIPLFEPPHNMSPGMVRFLSRMGYDSKVFATEIVNMAVHGLLKIDYKPGWFGSHTYTLIKSEHEPQHTDPLYQEIRDILFSQSSKIELNAQHSKIIERAQSRYLLHQTMGYEYLNDNSKYVLYGAGISLIILFIAFVMSGGYFSIISIIGIGVLLLTNVIFSHVIKTYTPEGRKVVDQIDGFKLFLSTTETERFKVIGTPPTKTPELYEKFLPYAMALDVEQAWSKQFAPVFDRLKSAGHPYQPMWLYAPISTFNINRLGSDLSTTISSTTNHTISSSGTPPGSSSGSGGRGSSGGGGGGGGVGGW